MKQLAWMGAGMILLALLTGCGKAPAPKTPEPVAVEVQAVTTAAARESFAYSGTIEESESIPLSFSTVGTVARVLVVEGEAVRKGQLLAVLDTTSFRSAWEMAHAVEARAEDAWNRLTPMHQNGSLPEIKYVEVETGLQQARAAAAIARKSLDDCRLVATTSGLVGKRAIDPGMVTVPNLASITLVNIARVYARISVPENEIAAIRKGDPALVTIGALGGREFSGRVEEVGVIADLLAHSYRIRIALANPGGDLKPGMICNAIIESAGVRRGLVVPSQAVLVDESGRRFVYVVAAGSERAERRFLETGGLLRNGIEVLAGIRPDERVVVSGQHKLADQARVRIITH